MTEPAPKPPESILEAALYVDDLDAAESFYGGLLGLERIMRAGNRHVFYKVGQGVLLIFNPDETAQSDPDAKLPVPPHGAIGPGHLCLAATEEEIDGWQHKLAAAGHAAEARFRWPNGALSLYVRDPAGNSIEFAEPKLWF